MAEGLFTRLQREVTQQQKEIERLESKIDESVRRLRQEMEQRDVNVMLMFEQILLKIDDRNTSKVVVELLDDVVVQNNELESIVADMLQTGIIKDNTSSFASPIVLVKKKYGS